MARAENLRQFAAGAPVSVTDFTTNYEILANSINNINITQLADKGILSDNIAYGAVTRDKIADGGVVTRAIADNAVITRTIADGSISRDKLASQDIIPPSVQSGYAYAEMVGANVPNSAEGIYDKWWTGSVTFPVEFGSEPIVVIGTLDFPLYIVSESDAAICDKTDLASVHTVSSTKSGFTFRCRVRSPGPTVRSNPGSPYGVYDFDFYYNKYKFKVQWIAVDTSLEG